MLFSGASVRHRSSGDLGVVRGGSESGWLVAFGGREVRLHGDDLERVLGDAAETLAAGHLGDSDAHRLMIQARYLRHAYQHDPLASLSNARIEFQRHQVFVAHRVTRKLRPRMILADEVGLGKTVEAGLVIKELRAREQVHRVLIVAPASLTRQWQTELSGKFNEQFELVDGAAAHYLGKGDGNPFLASPNIICSLPFASSKRRAEQILEAQWDLVVFDEAHRVRRTKQKETEAYKLADELKETANGLLLLTATPVQLHQYELYSLVQLVEPGLFRNEAAFEAARKEIPALNTLMLALDEWDARTPSDQAKTYATHVSMLRRAGCSSLSGLDDDDLRAAVVEKVIALHPLADVMIRNRKAHLGLAGRRSAVTECVELSAEERAIYEDVSAYIKDGYDRARLTKQPAIGFLMVAYQKMLTSSSHVLRTSFRRRIDNLRRDIAAVEIQRRQAAVAMQDWEDPEELSVLLEAVDASQSNVATIEGEIVELESLASRLDRIKDSKLARATEVCQRILAHDPDAKIVVFTQFLETQSFFARTLELNGISSVVFNGTQSAEAKERAVRKFRDESSVFVSTEAGGEGRNLQFANHLINYDLPWNPMKVEQRIGRLDRIGQRRQVNIYNLIAAGTLEERVLDVLANRIRLFEESVGALDPILGSIEKDIAEFAFSGPASSEDDAFNLFSQDIEERVRQARAVDKRLGDFVLDRASFRRDQLNEIQQQSTLADQADVEHFCREALDHLGGVLVEHEDGGEAVRLSPRAASRLGLPRQGYHGVFSALEAVRREELEFFAFGHDLVDSLIRSTTGGELTSTGVRQSDALPPGLWVEVVYETRSSVGQQRGRLTRHLVGADLQVAVSEVRQVPRDRRGSLSSVPHWIGTAVERSQARFDADFSAIRQTYLEEYELVRTELRKGAERLYDYRRDRLALQVEQARLWLDERAGESVSPRDARVTPARLGKLTKDLERLEELRERHELDLERIQQAWPSIQSEVAWASLVVGS